MIHETSTTKTHKSTHVPELKQRNDAESQTSPRTKSLSQVSGSDTELLLGNQTSSTPVQCLNDSH